MERETLVGIDVSKARLDVFIRPTGESFSTENSESGRRELVRRVVSACPKLVVLEATGGLEIPVWVALCHAEIAVAVVNPRQVRDFAKACGRLAKTDRLDSETLAHFAEAVAPDPRPAPTGADLRLAALVARRRQIVTMMTAEQARRNTVAESDLLTAIDRHIAWLQKDLRKVEGVISSLVGTNADWRRREEILRSVPGVGPVVSRTLVAELPELGRIDRKSISALVGVAPMARDSGTLRGKRTIWGGRAAVRATLYMASLVAARHNETIRELYVRLVSRGKPKKVALTACMRKLLTILNAMVRTDRFWNAGFPRSAESGPEAALCRVG